MSIEKAESANASFEGLERVPLLGRALKREELKEVKLEQTGNLATAVYKKGTLHIRKRGIISSVFSPKKQRAIRQINYDTATKVLSALRTGSGK